MTNTLLPPRPPPPPPPKTIARREGASDTSGAAHGTRRRRSPPACRQPRRAILIPGDEKQVLLGKYQSSTLLKPSAPHQATAATVPPRRVQASLVRAWDRGRRHGPPSRFTGRGGGGGAALGMEPGGHTRSPIVANKCAVAPSSSIFY